MVILSAFFIGEKMDVQHVFLVGAKSLGAYGGYETFVYKLTEYHQNNKKLKYHVACKANGDGCMDEHKIEGATPINDHEFEFHNAHCFKINIPQIGPAQAIYYDVAALNECCKYIKKIISSIRLFILWHAESDHLLVIFIKRFISLVEGFILIRMGMNGYEQNGVNQFENIGKYRNR